MNLVNPAKKFAPSSIADERKRAIAYSMDLLIPGLYIWIGSFSIRLLGIEPDDNPYKYPGTLNSRFGIALILPGYRIFTTYKNSYDPR
jgi:hypothetical protein